MVYTYLEPEIMLGISLITLKSMSIEKFSFCEEKQKYQANGDLSFFDYANGVRGSIYWKALKPVSTEARWIIERDGIKSYKEETGEFSSTTIDEDTNSVIDEFISIKLFKILEEQEKRGTVSNFIECLKLSGKSKKTHKGECVCHKLRESSVNKPFDWERMTRGKEIAQHCFSCSCGKDWWEHDPMKYLWSPVPDRRLYQHLIERDGVPGIACCEIYNEFYSLKTMMKIKYLLWDKI